VQSPATGINISRRTKPGRTQPQARLRLEPTHRTRSTKPYAVLPPYFFVMFFAKPTHLQHIYFFKKTEKNKRAAANAQNKNTRQKKLPEAK